MRENGVENLELEEGMCFLIVEANDCTEPFDVEGLSRSSSLAGGHQQQQVAVKHISERALIESLARMELQID